MLLPTALPGPVAGGAGLWAHPAASTRPAVDSTHPSIFMGMDCPRTPDRRTRGTSRRVSWPQGDPSCTFTSGHAQEEALHHHLHHPRAERAAEAPEREDQGPGGGVHPPVSYTHL